MKNIFENAYFGKPYKTRNNEKVLFIDIEHSNETVEYYRVWLEIRPGCYIATNLDGSDFYSKNNEESPNDIVSEWHEPIDEEKLDRLAELYDKNHDDIPPYANTDTVWRVIREAYKAGYRKSLEINYGKDY